MQNYEYSPKGVCSRRVTFDIDEGKLYNVHFEGGCNGKLLEGRDAREAAEILRGNDCQGRGTSCADQFAQAVEQALEANGLV